MKLLQKNLLVLVLSAFVYLAFFFFHHGQTSHTVNVLGATNNIALFQQPQTGRQPLLDAIQNAQKEIDMEMYLLTDKQIISSLIDAHNRGVSVQVLLEEHPFGTPTLNQKTYQKLKDAGINVLWTNPSFALTHEKAVIIDGVEVFILNQNLTTASFTKNREYDVIDANPDDVAQIKDIFFADANRKSISSNNSHLVVSPTNSRDMLISLLKGSQKEVDIEMEVIDDNEIIQVLEQKAAAIPVNIILPDFSEVTANKDVASQLSQHGVHVHTLSSPYVHAKLIIVDDEKAYVGSVNLTTQSMDANRELGIILSENDSINTLQADFQNDWNSSTTL